MTITKERVAEFIKNPLDNGLTRGEQMELARMALEGMEAEPVAWKVAFKLEGHPGSDFDKIFESVRAMNDVVSLHERGGFIVSVTPLYTAPQPLTTSERAELENYRNAAPVSFDDLRDAVAEVSGGPAMEWSDIYKGHQAVPFINFNSLARIVDKFRAAMQPIADMAEQLESARKHIAELEAGPPAPVGDGETPVPLLPDFPGRTLTQRECYRAGFEAGKVAGVKEGWMTVPVKPTAEMVAAAMLSNDVLFDQEDDTMFRVQHGEIWRAMLAAAPDFREIGNSSTKHFRENSEAPTNCPCWCRTCRPVKMNDMRFVVCPDCGNKRCPHANDHRNACTGSNELGQEGSAYPAAPQQESE